MQGRYLFFDTETCGLPRNFNAPVSDLGNWPRLVQLAYIYTESDGIQISRGNFIIRPEGFTIPTEASRIHGITHEKASREGHPLLPVLEHFHTLVERSDYLVAHNLYFDEKIIVAEFLRNHLSNNLLGRKRICTMRGTVEYCALPGPYGYKWPKLIDLHKRLFGTGFSHAHDAMTDVEMTTKCFWELKRRGVNIISS